MFDAPYWLLLVVVPAALAVGYLFAQQRRTTYALRFTNLDLLDEVAPEKPGWRRHLPAAGLLLALLMLVIGLARPTRAAEVPVELATVVIAFDTSISMEAVDVRPSRIVAAQAAAQAFLDDVPEQVRVGLVTFSATAIARVAPTTDRGAIERAIDNITLSEGTAIGDAIITAVDVVTADLEALAAEQPEGEEAPPATVVVMSDGDTTAGRPNEVGIQAAREAGIPVNSIAFGTANGTIEFFGDVVPVPVNEPALRNIARQTGGEFFDADSAEQLTNVFQTIGSAVGVTTEQVDISGWFMAFALVFGTAAGAGSLRWFSRLP